MSDTILCAISIERYFNVVRNWYHRMIVTNKSVTITIIIAILILTTRALFSALLLKSEIEQKYQSVLVTASSYTEITRLISAILNVGLLRNVKQIMKTSVIHQMLDAMLTKTVAIILATLVVLYLPILILFFIVAYIFINFTDA